MTWHLRIKEAREAEPKLSQKRLAEETGVSQALISKIELGQVRGSEHLSKLIDRLKLARSLFPDEAFKSHRGGQREAAAEGDLPLPAFARDPAYWAAAAGLVGDVPLFASAEGGEGELIIEREPIGTVRRPELLQGVKDGYAIYLVGESMIPEFEPGDTAMVNPRLPALSNTPCIFYSSDDDDPRALIKRYLSASDAEWRVEQFNPRQTFSLQRARWPLRHRIVSKNFR